MEHNSKERKTNQSGFVRFSTSLKPEDLDMLEKLSEAHDRSMAGELKNLIKRAFIMEFSNQKTA